MKTILTLLLVLTELLLSAQSIELRAGSSLIPSGYIALRYQQPTNYAIDFSIKTFLDKSRKHGLNYTAFGIDAMVEKPFSFMRVGIGPTVHVESEPWVYGDLSLAKRINYGIALEGAGELPLTDVFSLTAFVNQKFLFSKDLGRTHFVFGIGLSYHFSNN